MHREGDLSVLRDRVAQKHKKDKVLREVVKLFAVGCASTSFLLCHSYDIFNRGYSAQSGFLC